MSEFPSFFRLNNTPLYVHIFCLSVHLGCFHLLSVVNHAANNACVQMFLQESVFRRFWVYSDAFAKMFLSKGFIFKEFMEKTLTSTGFW